MAILLFNLNIRFLSKQSFYNSVGQEVKLHYILKGGFQSSAHANFGIIYEKCVFASKSLKNFSMRLIKAFSRKTLGEMSIERGTVRIAPSKLNFEIIQRRHQRHFIEAETPIDYRSQVLNRSIHTWIVNSGRIFVFLLATQFQEIQHHTGDNHSNIENTSHETNFTTLVLHFDTQRCGDTTKLTVGSL